MTKIIIDHSIISHNERHVLTNQKAILNDHKISYVDNAVVTTVTIKKDIINLVRENSEFKLILEFCKSKDTKGLYYIKKLDLNINVSINTKKIIIEKYKIYIKYDLYMNNEFSDSFIYNLEWRDLK